MGRRGSVQFSRRDMLRLSIMAGAGTLIGGRAWAACIPPEGPIDIEQAVNLNCGTGLEAIPFSPLILAPFTENLPLGTPGERKAYAPGWRNPDNNWAGDAQYAWTCRTSAFGPNYKVFPGPDEGCQDAMGHRPNGIGLPYAGTHQLYPGFAERWDRRSSPVNNYPDPILYHIRLRVAQHRITTSPVLPIGIVQKPKNKLAVIGPMLLPASVAALPNAPTQNGTDTVLGSGLPAYKLPASTIYGFNGTFPGPIINAEYGKPVLVRFENDLDINPGCLPRYDFGAPDWAFLTHLHNGHTAPESDGQPHHLTDNGGGYQPGQWSDNLYLMHPAGGDDNEKQSFLWFHDHRMHHTGANVYKGMVGLMPHYDPKDDPGDETQGLHLPGVKRLNGDGTFDVDYDIPMAFYDCCMDDGVTPHFDNHQPVGACGATHPEWWGQSFFRHYPNHGFVGDIFTVNGVAYPVLYVKARRYRFRFLGASIARCYELSLRTAPTADVGTGQTGIGLFPGQHGQWNFATRDRRGNVVRAPGTLFMPMLQIASEGGLLRNAISRNSIQIWPAKRREVIVDFTGMEGQVMYLTNTMEMPDGRKPILPGDRFAANGVKVNPNYAVPLVKIVVVPMGSGEVDQSETLAQIAAKTLRQVPSMSGPIAQTPTFTLTRGGLTDESQWVINGLEFDPNTPLHTVTEDRPEQWTIVNGGGGWTHPMHMHQEEHQVLSRVGGISPHPEDGPPAIGKEDVIALDPSESVTMYRNFRTFCGKFVAHCHNLAHEDHNMMFGWTIYPKP